MNISTAKAPFSFDTITKMMVNIAVDMDYAEDIFMNDVSNDDIPTIYKNRLATLMTYHRIKRNPSVETKICTVEYLVHVAIIFNETLLNWKVNMNANNIDKHKNNLHESLEYFKQWKESCNRNTGNVHNFLSLITYHNL